MADNNPLHTALRDDAGWRVDRETAELDTPYRYYPRLKVRAPDGIFGAAGLCPKTARSLQHVGREAMPAIQHLVFETSFGAKPHPNNLVPIRSDTHLEREFVG